MSGRYIATCGFDVKIHDHITYKLFDSYQDKAFKPGTETISDLSWSVDRKCLAILPGSGPVKIISVKNEKFYSPSTVNLRFQPTAISFMSNTNRYLAVGTKQGNLVIWDCKTKNVRKTFSSSGHDGELTQVHFNVFDNHIAASTISGNVLVFDYTNTVNKESTYQIPGSKSVSCIRFAGKYGSSLLAAGSLDGHVACWDTMSAAQVYHLDGAHSKSVTDLAFSRANTKLMVSVSLDKQLCCHDIKLQPGRPSIGIATPQLLTSVDLCQDGNKAVVATTTGFLLTYDLRAYARPMSTVSVQESAVQKVRYSRDNTLHSRTNVKRCPVSTLFSPAGTGVQCSGQEFSGSIAWTPEMACIAQKSVFSPEEHPGALPHIVDSSTPDYLRATHNITTIHEETPLLSPVLADMSINTTQIKHTTVQTRNYALNIPHLDPFSPLPHHSESSSGISVSTLSPIESKHVVDNSLLSPADNSRRLDELSCNSRLDSDLMMNNTFSVVISENNDSLFSLPGEAKVEPPSPVQVKQEVLSSPVETKREMFSPPAEMNWRVLSSLLEAKRLHGLDCTALQVKQELVSMPTPSDTKRQPHPALSNVDQLLFSPLSDDCQSDASLQLNNTYANENSDIVKNEPPSFTSPTPSQDIPKLDSYSLSGIVKNELPSLTSPVSNIPSTPSQATPNHNPHSQRDALSSQEQSAPVPTSNDSVIFSPSQFPGNSLFSPLGVSNGYETSPVNGNETVDSAVSFDLNRVKTDTNLPTVSSTPSVHFEDSAPSDSDAESVCDESMHNCTDDLKNFFGEEGDGDTVASVDVQKMLKGVVETLCSVEDNVRRSLTQLEASLTGTAAVPQRTVLRVECESGALQDMVSAVQDSAWNLEDNVLDRIRELEAAVLMKQIRDEAEEENERPRMETLQQENASLKDEVSRLRLMVNYCTVPKK